jgi:quercetin dioxygenase-like cupin family protein
MGNRATIKATAHDTDGAFSMLEFVAEPGASASPPHVHTREEECLYVLDGRLVVTVGEDERVLEAGGFAYMPRGIVHTWRNPDPTPTRFLTMLLPGGGELFFQDLAAVLATGASDSVETIGPLMIHHGIRPTEPALHVLEDDRSTVS